MKKNLRTSILIAFAVFIALTLGASRLAHVFSRKALLEEELKSAREDLEDVTVKFQNEFNEGRDLDGINFFEQASKVESVGRWDCCYVLCDTSGRVIAPSALAGKPLEYSVYQQLERRHYAWYL